MSLHSRIAPSRGLATAALVLTLLIAGCGGGSDDGKGPDPADGPSADSADLASIMPVVDGQQANQADGGLFLEWTPVEGATAYSVTVADDNGVTWSWVGPETRVTYGTLPLADGDAPESFDPDHDLAVAFEWGRDHRWSVMAFGPDDEILAIGPLVDLAVSD